MRNNKGQFIKDTMRKDITGQKFGMLTALEFSHVEKKNNNRRTYWVFQCDCGEIKVLRVDQVKSGNTLSCGCHKQVTDANNLNRQGSKPKYNYIGKLEDCVLYSRWHGMIRRCYNRNFIQYNNYGGRGIKVCDEWLHDFSTFFNWSMNNGFSEELEIDRIDNNGNYCPENCRWITHKENMQNTRRSIKNKQGNTEITKQIA